MASEQMWTVRGALEWTLGYLERKGDEHPRLSAEWLLCHATGFSRVEVYMNYDRPLDEHERSVLRDAVARRGRGEPLQYVTGEMPFRHIVLKCAPGVLIPRPETEVLVDCVLEYLDPLIDRRREEASAAAPAVSPERDGAPDDADAPAPEKDGGPDDGRATPDGDVATPMTPELARVLEIGTGTGCIALSIAGERPGVHVCATDISQEAFDLASRNRGALGLDDAVDLYLTDLADDVPGAIDAAFDVLVSNPPYIPSKIVDELPHEVGGFEPRLALDGGPDGLDVFRAIVERAVWALRPGGLLACELHEDCLQAAAREPAVTDAFEDVHVVRDLTGRDRILLARLRG